ncbi:YafY family transcriptional regulator [Clostridium sp. SHJSY1]|uniref:helix-turn-helix transcriptional regulator n=1 Tax=Clostridium sp. SHJSY1 TaxID=2942483 RepID=UPI00287657AD|nr:YafY family protein [Clostridium sp. SHJSY1]MDS0524627.1 YafY family transcriptional regulator [Clostridium sp. SHJSY1]
MKIDRLISIITILNNKGRTTAKEFSERFEVSVKTIQRDIISIDQAGIPIVSYQGKDGGYEILDSYRINGSVINGDDVYIISQLLNGLFKSYNSEHLEILREKFKSIDNKESSSRMIIDFSSWSNGEKIKKKLELIDKAFTKKRKVSFQYNNVKGEFSNRTVEPVKIIFKSMNWYLVGFCLLKNDMRMFKVRRMNNLSLGEIYTEEREFKEQKFFNNREKDIIKLKLKSNEGFLRKVDDYFDEYKIDGNIIEIELPEDEWVYSMLLSLGSKVEVIAPEHVRKIITNMIEEMKNLYK